MISLQCSTFHGIGYGRMGAAIEKGLAARGYGPQPIDAPDVPPVALFITMPNHVPGWWKGQHSVLFSMWETTYLPATYREALHNYDLILVPSKHNLDLFSDHHPNVKQVPLGVDSDVWQYRERSAPDPFVFFTSGTGQRKGYDLSVKAFKRVRDVIVARGQQPPRQVMLTKMRIELDPDISTINYQVSDEDELNLYTRAHCYLAPSRGEGWGLQPHQAMAQGCPTILSDMTGHREFAHLGYTIPAPRTSKADYILWGDSGDWWEPDLDALAERMLWVHDHYAEATAFARANADAARAISWDATVDALIDAIGPVLDAPELSERVWRRAQLALYPIIPSRDLTCDIGGITYTFTKGVPTEQPADVKRILHEAGYLDPICIDEALCRT